MRTLTRLGWNVRRRRVQRGWSVEELAAKARISVHVLNRIEGAKGNPAIDVVFRLARALGTHPHKLFDPVPPKKPPRPS